MDELLLPVTYKGTACEFPLRIVPQGFVYHFIVQVADTEVVIERDDSGEFRALVYNQDVITPQLPETGLVAAMIEVLRQL